ncbi:unnamed protein product [Ranitomeya imitator]|uniref:RRM domain-containing protein n=1 Tax=Ranitomeya imitator TaxID=111125 RepID=A0ABN9M6H1_9NEOB|nr:unnamed protein product [Ranitomeya imitator]
MPSIRNIDDFHGVMPKDFPHICSLCDLPIHAKKGWHDHVNGPTHRKHCLLLINLYPDWKGHGGGGEPGMLRQSTNHAPGLLGPPPPAHSMLSMGGGPEGRRGNQRGHLGMYDQGPGPRRMQNRPHTAGRVVQIKKFERGRNLKNQLLWLAEPFGVITNFLILNNMNEAFIEMSTPEEAMAVADYYSTNQALIHGKPVRVHLSQKYKCIKKLEKPEVKSIGKKTETCKVVHLSKLPSSSYTDTEFLKLVEDFGKVKTYILMRVRNQSFVEMEKEEDAQDMVKRCETVPLFFHGKPLKVELSERHKKLVLRTVFFRVTGCSFSHPVFPTLSDRESSVVLPTSHPLGPAGQDSTLGDHVHGTGRVSVFRGYPRYVPSHPYLRTTSEIPLVRDPGLSLSVHGPPFRSGVCAQGLYKGHGSCHGHPTFKGDSGNPYLDDLLIKGLSRRDCSQNLQLTLDTLLRLGWIINYQKSSLIPTQRLEFLGMEFDTSQAQVFLPKEKFLSLRRGVRVLKSPSPLSLRLAMRVLGKMVASMEAVPYAQFHSRPLQLALLSAWDRNSLSLDCPFRLSPRVKQSLSWWTLSTSILRGRAIFLALIRWESLLSGKPVRIQSDNTRAVAYINHQRGTRSTQVMAEVAKILRWAEGHVPSLSAVHIPGVDNWEANFLSRQGIVAGEWSLLPAIFNQICQRWGVPDVDLMASRANHKVPQYISRSHDPMAVRCDTLVIPWTQFQMPYLFPPLPLIPRIVKKIKTEGVPVLLVAPDWPRRAWYAELVNMLSDVPWRLPDLPDLLSQGPLFHPNSRSLNLSDNNLFRMTFSLPSLLSVLQAGLDSGLSLSTLKGQISALSILFQRYLASLPQVAFLVAITSIRRVSELAALSCRSPFLVMHQDKVVLRPVPSFLPKVVSAFHINEDIVLPSLCPSPVHPLEKSLHKLDVADPLFIVSEGRQKGLPASKSTIARWIRSAVLEAYRVQDKWLTLPRLWELPGQFVTKLRPCSVSLLVTAAYTHGYLCPPMKVPRKRFYCFCYDVETETLIPAMCHLLLSWSHFDTITVFYAADNTC